VYFPFLNELFFILLGMKKEQKLGFADYLVGRRKIKQDFFNQVNLLIDWRKISNIINKHYQKGESVTGAPSYDGLVLFKMALLQTWYGLSDYEVEDRVNDSISFSRFVGISLDDSVPDHSVLSRFRTELTKKGAYDKIFKALNKQLDKHNILVKTGAIIDASIIDTPLKPKGPVRYEIETDRATEERKDEQKKAEENEQKLLKKEKPGVDTEARWIKKSGKLRYGYKKHFVTDEEGLVLGVLTTPANVNEIANLEEVLDTADLPEGIALNGDKGYSSVKNEEILKKKKLKSRILSKATKGKPLTEREKLRNKLIGKTRFKVERTFASIKRWFKSEKARYKGLAKMHTQNIMEAIAYNLYRSPGRVASNSFKMAK
jgi:IS5 family transposase